MDSPITGQRVVSSMNGERPTTGTDQFKGAEASSGRRSDRPTTIGRYLLDQALPEPYRDPERVWDAKTADKMFATLAREQPDAYADILYKLGRVARDAQGSRGGVSPSIRHVRESAVWKKRREAIRREIKTIYGDPSLSLAEKKDRLIRRMAELSPTLTQEVFDEADKSNNPFAWIVKSGMKGKPANINNLIGTPLLFADAKNRPIPIPILHGYGRGLSPSEYWAASYGTRKGLVDTKMATADAGYLSKQLVQIAHRSVVTDDDDVDNPDDESRGLPVDLDDDDNIGTLLARSAGPYGRNTVVTAKVLRKLKRRGIKRILVRSPTVGGPQDGSVYAKDVGLREQGRLCVRGENPGVAAAHALSEPLSQGSISSKHTAGVVGAHAAAAISGFQAINQFIQVPKENRNWAAHAKSDGRVQKVDKAPQGGHYVYINNEPVYVPHGSDVTVKPGDEIEAGDILSTGLPNPSLVVEHKGIGEGRRYFVQELTKMLRDANMTVNRRNVELIARGLVNHVELGEEMDAYVPGDKVPYNMLEKFYQPRRDARTMDARMAVGKYLERPVLHYTIGTKIRPSVVKNLKEFGLDGQISVHDNPPPFQPQMVRGMAIAAHDPDWVSSMQGSGIKSRVLTAVHRGHSSDPLGTSYVSGVVVDPNFAQGHSGGKITAPIDRLSEMQRKRLEAPENPFDLDNDDD